MDWFHPTLGILSASQNFVLNDIQYPSNWLRGADAATREALGFVPVTVGEKPDERYYWVTEERNGPNITYTGIAKDLDSVKKLILADLAAKRYQVEVGGIELNGSVIATDRETQAKISGAVSAVAAGLPAPLTWKGPGGFVTLDAPTLTAIALAIASHVQACFVNEAFHADKINGKQKVETVLAYDYSTGWPANPVPASV